MHEESFSYTSIIPLLSASVTTDNTLAEGRHTATRLFLCKDNEVARLHACWRKITRAPCQSFILVTKFEFELLKLAIMHVAACSLRASTNDKMLQCPHNSSIEVGVTVCSLSQIRLLHKLRVTVQLNNHKRNQFNLPVILSQD